MLKQETEGLLQLVRTVCIPALPTFRATGSFGTGCSRYLSINDDFCQTFLAGDGLVEDAVEETTLRIHKLLQDSVNNLILAELGEAAKITLGQMSKMMISYNNLLGDGYVSVFYIADANNTLWAVRCHWCFPNHRWMIGAFPSESPHPWQAGIRVISR